MTLVKDAHERAECLGKEVISAGSNPYLFLITLDHPRPPTLYKLSKINNVLRLYGLVMTANFTSPAFASEHVDGCSFISTPLQTLQIEDLWKFRL